MKNKNIGFNGGPMRFFIIASQENLDTIEV